MGVRATISKVEKSGAVRAIHIHWAQPHNVGMILKDHFSTENAVDRLLSYGQLDSITAIKGSPKDYPSEYGTGKWGVFVVMPTDKIEPFNEGFLRIRQASNSFIPADNYKDYHDFHVSYYDKERDFMFIDGKWWVTSKDFDRFLTMDTVAKLLEMEQPTFIVNK